MRVLEVMGSLHRGGAETMIMNYYRAFDRDKCQFDFVVHALFEDDYRAEAEALGANVILLERPGKIGALKYIKSLAAAIRANGPYDAIHLHTNHQAFMGILAAKIVGVKNVIVHSHTTEFRKFDLLVNRFFIKLFKVKALACGEAAGEAFFANYPYVVINNAIDAKRFKQYDSDKSRLLRKTLFGEHQVVGHLGRFTHQKNHRFLIDVAEKVVANNKDIVFALYGEGELQEEIQEEILKRRLNDNIKVMGVTNDVITTYHMFDLFVLPSLVEGFPVTLVESQLSGISTLTSDNVTHECDLKLGLIEYLPLENAIWVDAIQRKLAGRTEEGCADVSEYDVATQWVKLYDVYRL